MQPTLAQLMMCVTFLHSQLNLGIKEIRMNNNYFKKNYNKYSRGLGYTHLMGLICSFVHYLTEKRHPGIKYMEVEGQLAVWCTHDFFLRGLGYGNARYVRRMIRLLESAGILKFFILNAQNGHKNFKDCNHKYYYINHERVAEILEKGKEFAKELLEKAKQLYKENAQQYMRKLQENRAIKALTNKYKSTCATIRDIYKERAAFFKKPKEIVAIKPQLEPNYVPDDYKPYIQTYNSDRKEYRGRKMEEDVSKKYEPVADTYKCLSIIEGSTETMKRKDFRKYLLRKVGPEVYYSWFMQGIFKELPDGKEEFVAPNAWAATRWQELFKWMNKANDYLNGKRT